MKKRFGIVLAFLLLLPLVQGATKEEAYSHILLAEEAIATMETKELSITEVQDALRRAIKLYGNQDYVGVLLLTDQINKTKEQAIYVNAFLDELEQKTNVLQQQNIPISIVQERLALAKTALHNGDYVNAERYAEDTRVLLETIEDESSITGTIQKARGFRPVVFFKTHWKWSILTLSILSSISFFGYRAYNRAATRRKIQTYKTEQKDIQNLIKKAQQEYFINKEISKQEYTIRLNRYHEKLRSIKKELPLLQKKHNPAAAR